MHLAPSDSPTLLLIKFKPFVAAVAPETDNSEYLGGIIEQTEIASLSRKQTSAGTYQHMNSFFF
ncbi:MAG: hypothetical protein D3907_13565 [Candidatus Electrothrix sp. AUS3]|nr:hypothetical protein [Candidatus Electrothrix gigas]